MSGSSGQGEGGGSRHGQTTSISMIPIRSIGGGHGQGQGTGHGRIMAWPGSSAESNRGTHHTGTGGSTGVAGRGSSAGGGSAMSVEVGGSVDGGTGSRAGAEGGWSVDAVSGEVAVGSDRTSTDSAAATDPGLLGGPSLLFSGSNSAPSAEAEESSTSPTANPIHGFMAVRRCRPGTRFPNPVEPRAPSLSALTTSPRGDASSALITYHNSPPSSPAGSLPEAEKPRSADHRIRRNHNPIADERRSALRCAASASQS